MSRKLGGAKHVRVDPPLRLTRRGELVRGWAAALGLVAIMALASGIEKIL